MMSIQNELEDILFATESLMALNVQCSVGSHSVLSMLDITRTIANKWSSKFGVPNHASANTLEFFKSVLPDGDLRTQLFSSSSTQPSIELSSSGTIGRSNDINTRNHEKPNTATLKAPILRSHPDFQIGHARRGPDSLILKWVYPPAKFVEVAGTFTDPPWQILIPLYLCPISSLHWINLLEVFPELQGSHEYKLVVDGEWKCDPYAPICDDGSAEHNLNNFVSIMRQPIRAHVAEHNERRLSALNQRYGHDNRIEADGRGTRRSPYDVKRNMSQKNLTSESMGLKLAESFQSSYSGWNLSNVTKLSAEENRNESKGNGKSSNGVSSMSTASDNPPPRRKNNHRKEYGNRSANKSILKHQTTVDNLIRVDTEHHIESPRNTSFIKSDVTSGAGVKKKLLRVQNCRRQGSSHRECSKYGTGQLTESKSLGCIMTILGSPRSIYGYEYINQSDSQSSDECDSHLKRSASMMSLPDLDGGNLLEMDNGRCEFLEKLELSIQSTPTMFLLEEPMESKEKGSRRSDQLLKRSRKVTLDGSQNTSIRLPHESSVSTNKCGGELPNNLKLDQLCLRQLWPPKVLELLHGHDIFLELNIPKTVLRATSGLKLTFGYCAIAHPGKSSSADAFFCSRVRGGCVGVADGVGEWDRFDIDSSEFANDMMAQCQLQLETQEPTVDDDMEVYMRNVMTTAYESTTKIGSSTCLIASLDARGEALAVANLGDSTFVVLRRGGRLSKFQVICRGSEQQHRWNMPYQLSRLPIRSDLGDLAKQSKGMRRLLKLMDEYDHTVCEDKPNDCEVSLIPICEGDLVILGTDGVFDNLFDDELVTIANMCISPSDAMALHDPDLATSAQAIATTIAEAAEFRSQDMTAKTPFALKARRNGTFYTGGKIDDISVVASWVIGRDSVRPKGESNLWNQW